MNRNIFRSYVLPWSESTNCGRVLTNYPVKIGCGIGGKTQGSTNRVTRQQTETYSLNNHR